MTAPVKAGLIGCGSLSLIGILPQLAEPDAKERLELVAVCDVNEARARETAERFGVADAYSDPQELIARDDIDLVLIITPIEYHYSLAMDALRASKHVYTEKPVATSVSEAIRLRTAARERNLKLVCAPSVLLFPQIRYARSLLDEGAIGEVHSASGRGLAGVPPWSGYTSDPSQYFSLGGGPALEWAFIRCMP